MRHVLHWLTVWIVLYCVSGVVADPPAKASGCKPLYGVIYDPFAVSTGDICLSKEQAAIDVQIMATVAKSIRLYNIAVCPEATKALMAEAQKHNVSVLLGLFLGPSAEANDDELAMMETVMESYSGAVQAVVVGSDALVSGKIGTSSRYAKFLTNVEVLVEYIGRVKKTLNKKGWKHPVTTSEGWGVWESENGAALAEAVDFICLKMTPYYEGRPAVCHPRARNCMTAASYSNARATGLSKYYTKDVWVCETSWPSEGNACCNGIPDKRNGFQAKPSSALATKYLNEFIEGAGSRPYYISSAFDRDWRRIWSPCPYCAEKNLALSSFENGICDLCEQEYQLGIFDQHRERKDSFKLPSVKCPLPGLPEIRIAVPVVNEEPEKVTTAAKSNKKAPKKANKQKKSTSKSEGKKATKKSNSKPEKAPIEKAPKIDRERAASKQLPIRKTKKTRT